MLIPDLKGLTLEQAKERLDKMGLSLGAVEMEMIRTSLPMLLFPKARIPAQRQQRGRGSI